MFSDAALSTSNYDALLIGWAEQPVQDKVSFYVGDSRYCTGEDTSASKDVGPLWVESDTYAYIDILPEYQVTDSVGNVIPGEIPYGYFTADYEFEVPDPANTGTWQGEVTVDFGPYQADGTDTVNFDVVAG